jgi:MYXO-CTERM domain-containing protein
MGTMGRALSALGVILGVSAVSAVAGAQVAWFADLETGDLSQWQGALNEQNIEVVTDPVAEGSYAAEITLTNDATWPNGLRRVELRHLPDPSRTAEGAETYFAWSFYLPETLPTDPAQQIGYWESQQSYQQMMAFPVDGERIRFVTRQPSNVTQWEDTTAATAGQWHRIAMHILWSKDENVGRVDVWFDGQQVVTAGPAKTLADDNPHFTQIGLLRGDMDFSDAPVILIDHAIEGDSLGDVEPDALSAGGGGAGGVGTGGSSVGSGGAGGAETSTGNGGDAGTGGAASTGGGSSSGSNGDDGGCGCRVAGQPTEGRWWWVLSLALMARRRRGR